MLWDEVFAKLRSLPALLPTACPVLGKRGEKREDGKEMFLFASSSPHTLSEAEWQQPSADQCQKSMFKGASGMFPLWTQGLVAGKW